MEVILLEKITKLGDPGDLVNVKSGFARNFLIPFSKAIKANEENKAEYEQRKLSLEKAELERKSLAIDLANKGWKNACKEDHSLDLGLNTHNGNITCKGVAEAFGYNFVPPEKVL